MIRVYVINSFGSAGLLIVNNNSNKIFRFWLFYEAVFCTEVISQPGEKFIFLLKMSNRQSLSQSFLHLFKDLKFIDIIYILILHPSNFVS